MIKTLKMLCTCVGLLLVLSGLFSNEAIAQRPIRSAVNSGCYRQPIVPISAIPTLHMDMSFDCILGYIYLDSLCRSTSLGWEQIDSMVETIYSFDTLKPFMRFEYRMKEYDADLLSEYEAAAGWTFSNYKAPAAVRDVVRRRMNKVLGPTNKLSYITRADLILKIKVTNISSDIDSMASTPVNPLPMVCVEAVVLDTIKGLHFRTFSQEGGAAQIRFNYSPFWRKSNYADGILTAIDSLGNEVPCSECYGPNAVTDETEYIVFLRTVYLDHDGTNSFYAYWPMGGYSTEGGIFQINPIGKVQIPSNYFGYGTLVPLSTFETDIRNDIDIITSH